MASLFMVIVATAAGTVFGILLKYWMDKNLIEDAYIEWEDEHKAEIDFYKKREQRMAAEISRLHVRKVQEEHPQKANKEPWLVALEDTSEAPDWVDVDFGKEW